jgi:putative nucleotidyltransferase with HDIG domain
MSLQGDLGSIPLADVIQLVAGSRRSGTLYVAAPEDARVLQFREGELVSASSLEVRFRLGHALCQRGLLEPARLEHALQVQRQTPGRVLGDVLLAEKAITIEGLRATLREQVQDALDDVLHWGDGGFLFSDTGAEQIPAPSGITFVVQPLLFEAIRKLDEWAGFSKLVEDRTAVLEFPEGVGEGSLPPGADDALAVFEQIDGRRNIAQVIGKLPWSEHRVVRSIATLYEAGMVKFTPGHDSAKFMPSMVAERGRFATIAPRAAARAIALATIEKAGAVDMHAAAMADPGLAIAVLRAASSIGRHESRQFGTLAEAVMDLGDDPLRRVLVAAGLRGCYCTANRWHSEDLWRHSIVTAVTAARLVRALGMPAERGAEAYLCGLLHDIGALMLRSSAGADYDRVEQLVAAGTPRADAERKVIGVGHDKIGAHALEKWGAAPAVIEVALMHHMGPKSEPWQLAVVQAADAIAVEAGYDAEALENNPPLRTVTDRTLGLSPELLERVLGEVGEEAAGRDPLW